MSAEAGPPWAMWSALIAGTVLLISIWVNWARPWLRRKNLSQPVDAYFHIWSLQDGHMPYVVQDDRGHNVQELVLPPNSTQYVEMQYKAKIHFHLDTFIFECRSGPENERPIAKERVNRFIAVGKNRWIPGQDDTDVINRRGGYHVRVDRPRNVGTWSVLGFELQTKGIGVFEVNLGFIADEIEGNATLTIRVEDPIVTKRIRCTGHEQCFIRPFRNPLKANPNVQRAGPKAERRLAVDGGGAGEEAPEEGLA
jgi:hypothetical protein